ncbi:MAG: oligosaccharide flippase family protein, partial [Gammaproteobacteria bacterium]
MIALLRPLLGWAGDGFGIERSALPAFTGVGGGASRHLVQRAAASMALRLTAALLSLLSSVALARFLGAQGFGAYSYALTLVGLVAVPVTLGVPQLLVREVAAYGARGQWGEMGGLLRRANQVALGGSLLLALAAFAVSSHFLGGVDAGGYAAFAVGLVMLPLMALAAMRMAALQGLGYVVLRQLPEGVCKPLLLLVFVFSASVLMGHGQLTPVRAMAMHLVAAGLAFLLGAWFLHTRMPPHVRNVDPQYEHRIWLREVMPLLLLGGVQFANQQVGLLMVGSLKGPEAAGLYQVATRVAECIPLVLMAANAVLAPLVSQLYARGDIGRLQQLVTATSRAVFYCSAPIALALIIGGWWLLPAVFGADFARAST